MEREAQEDLPTFEDANDEDGNELASSGRTPFGRAVSSAASITIEDMRIPLPIELDTFENEELEGLLEDGYQDPSDESTVAVPETFSKSDRANLFTVIDNACLAAEPFNWS